MMRRTFDVIRCDSLYSHMGRDMIKVRCSTERRMSRDESEKYNVQEDSRNC